MGSEMCIRDRRSIDRATPVSDEAAVAASNAENQAAFEQILTSTRNDDPAWSEAMEARLSAAIANDAAVSEHRDLEITCAATLCRVTALVPGAEQDPFLAEGFFVPVTQAGGSDAPEALAWGTPDGNGGLRYQIWLAREGNTDLLDT